MHAQISVMSTYIRGEDGDIKNEWDVWVGYILSYCAHLHCTHKAQNCTIQKSVLFTCVSVHVQRAVKWGLC